MAQYVISYDVHDQRNHAPVWAKLERWGAVRLLESLWLLTSNNTTAQLRDELQASIEYNDSLVILEVKAGARWASFNAKEAGINWLKRNLSP